MTLHFEEFAKPDAPVTALFMRSFKAPPPDHPRHFVALHVAPVGREVCAYVHLTPLEHDVFLLGGLCVDPSIYRRMTPGERHEVAGHGSMSRWLLAQSIELAGSKRAVFAYTGNALTRRDCLALGFLAAAGPYLLVQWHDQPASERDALIRRVERLGPF